LALAITQGASFVAQGFAGDVRHLTNLITTAAQHKGFALVNVLQPCVTFNKVNTYQWYRERIFKVDDEEVGRSKIDALKLVVDSEKIPTGVIYREIRPTYEESLPQLKEKALVEKEPLGDLNKILSDFA
jgi:2-oxoglutarate ferredoxin oxidoreductase subunit beta